MRKVIATVSLFVAFASLASAQAPAAAAREDLSNLPESQAVLFVNARRITNEALPALVPASKYQPVFDQAKVASVDVQKIDYVLAGVHYTDATLSGAAPVEFGVIVRGGFNADALLSMARFGGQGKYREETHAGKTVSIFKVDLGGEDKGANKGASGGRSVKLPGEIAAVALGPDSLLVGTPAYVAAALDARGGAGARVKSDLVDLALRDAGALVSLAGDLPPSLSKYIDTAAGSKGEVAEMFNPEMRRLVDSLRQVQFSLNFAAARFGAQAALRADAPENARAISGLIATGLNAVGQAAGKDAARGGRALSATDQRGLALIKSITNTVEGDEVVLTVSAPQTTVASFVQDALAPSRQTAPRAGARPAPGRRRAPARRRG
jgi:hypothetical protein